MQVFLSVCAPNQAPIPNVDVRLFNRTGSQQLGEAQTDIAGQVRFELDAGTYSVRLAKRYIAFKSQYFFLTQPGDTSASFVFEGTPIAPPASRDPNFCTLYGYVMGSDGVPAGGSQISFFPKFDAKQIGQTIFSPLVTRAKADAHGFLVAVLLRGHEYACRFEDHYDWVIPDITVPNQPSVEVTQVLFPTLAQVLLVPPAPFLVLEGSTVLTRPTLTLTNGKAISPATVNWRVDESTVATVEWDGEFLRIHGVSPGATQIFVEPIGIDAQPTPLPAVEGVPIDVSVLAQ
jgi:hypothetical protein